MLVPDFENLANRIGLCTHDLQGLYARISLKEMLDTWMRAQRVIAFQRNSTDPAGCVYAVKEVAEKIDEIVATPPLGNGDRYSVPV